ncbi:MAG: GAF domain-containing protein [Anaerolineaceae bacterium]|nr:GAF domain-containing protein [Anaerolineaceae bacterium]
MQDIESLLYQNRLLTEEVKRRIDQLAAINTVATSVSQSLDLDRTLKTALKTALGVVGADAGGISLIDYEAGEVVLRAQHGWEHDFTNPPMRVPVNQGMSGQVITSDEVVLDNDLDGTEQLAVPRFHDEHFRSIAMAPMHARGKIIGILSIMSNKPNAFDDEIITVLKAIADTVGVALDNARLYESTVEHEKRLDAVLQSTADGIISTDQHGRIRLINHAAASMFDVSSARLIGAPLREAPIHPRARDSLLFALSSDKSSSRAFKVTMDNERVVALSVSPVYVESQVDHDRLTDGWVIVTQDLTYMREEEMARTEFIRAAAHDMRNPLGVTISSLNILQEMVGKPEEDGDGSASEVVRLALSGVNRLQDLINDVLNLEQIDSGYDVNLAEVDIKELIREIGAEAKPLLQERSLTFSTDFPDTPLNPQMDRKWVRRAVVNYLDNAIKYTQPGGHITMRAFTNDMHLHIEVVDNGPGISMEAQAHLFERFYRVVGTEKIRGTGLGLAIVKSIAEAHGGSVYVRSQKGQGSTFGMTLLMSGTATT